MLGIRQRLPLLVSVILLFSLAATTLRGLDSRVPNTTLTVPEEPEDFGYQTINAFGNLTFTRPVALVDQPGEINRYFVVEQAGRIYVITNLANPTKTLFMDISSIVDDSSNEEGLLGMAFHPDWQNNGFFYLFYTINTTVNGVFGRHDRLARFEIDPSNSNAGLSNSESPLFSQYDQRGNHNGGDLHFGPDDYLYVALGDEGGSGDQYNNSRYIDKDFFSAILRIDVDKKPGNPEPNTHPAVHMDGQNKAYYSIPLDNPFIGATSFNAQTISPGDVRTEFWAAGLRNPWRFSFDSETGVLYCADVGQGVWEEVDIIVKGGDYGWRLREGLHPYNGNTVPDGVTVIDPIVEYPHSSGPTIPGGTAVGKSITGGVVYRGERYAQLRGFYVFADYVSQRVYMLRYNEQTGLAEDFQQITTASSAAGFGIDPSNGDVLIARLGGTISRLIYSDTPVTGSELPATLSATGAFTTLSTLTPEAGIVPYDINVPFWSDHAIKSRWFSVPDISDTITFDRTANWSFPSGTVWIKHFDLELTNGVAASSRRIETRFIVKNDDGAHGFTYKWNAQETDADLVAEGGEDEVIPIYNPNGSLLRNQNYRYPGRSECLQCHTSKVGFAAGFNTLQLNYEFDYGNGATNQITALSRVGYFAAPVTEPHSLPALAAADDDTVSLEYRVRSYLQANCSQCHQPGGTAQGNWDARVITKTDDAGLINGDLLSNGGDPANKAIVPGDTAHSQLLQRILIRANGQMPPLASSELDQAGIDLLTAWINTSLPIRQTFSEYQVALFGSTENPDAAADADFDGDGADTYTEWLTGTDAKVETDVWKVNISQNGDTVNIGFDHPANRGFDVEFKSDLSNGSQWNSLEVPSNAPSFPSATQPAIITDNRTNSPSRYYRVRVFEP